MMAVFSAFGALWPRRADGRRARRLPGHDGLEAPVLWLILIWTLLCGLVGLAIFYRRELARVTI